MTKDTDRENGLPMSRKEAKIAGEKYYFTGRACVRGHVSKRFSSNGWCYDCAKSDVREAAAKRREDNPDAVRSYDKNWRESNRDRVRQLRAKWAEENPEKIKAMKDAWLASNPSYEKDRSRRRREVFTEDDRKTAAQRQSSWRNRNPDKVRVSNKKSNEKRMANPKGKLEITIRNGMMRGIKKGSKAGARTFDILGYTVDELFAHLESLFSAGMTWDNHGRGGWHIDHIIPLSAFNYHTPHDMDFKLAWSLSNLQPLWQEENLRKHAKLNSDFQPNLALAIPQQTAF